MLCDNISFKRLFMEFTRVLTSQKIQRRQSEIRQQLAELAGKDQPDDNEIRSMTDLDKEYRANEGRFRAALIAEDEERREAGADLETREGKEWSDLVADYEIRQVALHLDEGLALEGRTAEVVAELRSHGGYRGIPVPFEVLEQRAGETIAGGVPDPVQTQPIIERLFPNSVAAAMGARLVNIASGQVEYPVTTSAVSAGWASSETGSVAGPTAYATTDRVLKPNQNLGVTMKITRRAMKQTAGIEQAIRRDLRGAIQAELDKAAFQGSGASGQPLGIVAGQSTYGYTDTALGSGSGANATWADFLAAMATFITGNAATGPADVRILMRPEVWAKLDSDKFDTGSGITLYDRLVAKSGAVVASANALAAPATNLSKVLLTTTAGGVAPFFLATWGAVDLIRDPFSDAASGGLRLTGLVTADVTVSRPAQIQTISKVKDI